MKYEAVFGDQSLFDGASKDAVIAIKRPFISGVRSEEMYFFSSTFDAVMKAGSSFNFNNVILKTAEYAERRIIAEPKRWTWEDKKAGRLPEVDCVVRATGMNEDARIAAINNDSVCVVFEDGAFVTLHVSGIAPIETPEEKAQREEDEFISSLSGADIQDGTVKDFFAQGARAAYRKLKGGE